MKQNMRIVVLGGGVGGLAATRQLERRFAGRHDVEVVLVSRDNFFLLSPLLFEACSGVLELRHCAQPIRPCLKRAQFVEATVEQVDVDRQIVHVRASDGRTDALAYDQLIVALGATTNTHLIDGSSNAGTFKTVADALRLRNHLIEQFERADVETNEARRRALLTVVVVGGGLVGVELLGELTALTDAVLRYYHHIAHDDVHFHLFEGADRLIPESSPDLAAYAQRVLRKRGAVLHTNTRVQSIEPGRVHWGDDRIDAATIVLVAGITPSTAASGIPVERHRRGHIITDATMRSVSHPQVWALGDCAFVPGPDGQPYPALAQHAIREGRAVARNVHAVAAGRQPAPFVYRMLGTMVALGRTRAAARFRHFMVTGFFAWWLRRTYYLFQMPRWDTRLRIVFDWTVSLFLRPDITKVDLDTESDQLLRNAAAGAGAPVAPAWTETAAR